MNCAYHGQNTAVVNCNGCGKPLCPACDHRVKGFPFCQDCIVAGVDMLRHHNQTAYAPYVKKKTSPVIALLLSFILPGLGAAYNGQTVKALVYFAIFAGLFQVAIIGGGPIFVLGFVGMWLYSALDAWRTAQMIRSGITPDVAEDILVQRFSGNPKMWGIFMLSLGILFVLQVIVDIRFLMRGLVPAMLIGLGIYILHGYLSKKRDEELYKDIQNAAAPQNFVGAIGGNDLSYDDYETKYSTRDRSGTTGWRS